MDSSGINVRRWIGIFVGVIIVIGLAVILLPARHDREGSPRDDHLQSLTDELNLAENQKLMWTPLLAADAYKVGAVFKGDNFSQQETAKCDQLRVTPVQPGFTRGANMTYKFSPEVLGPAEEAVKADGIRTVEYRLTVTEGEIASAYQDMIESLLSDPDCLAAVANREVILLYGVYRGDEKYIFTRSLGGSLSAGSLLPNLAKKLGISGEWTDKGDFSRDKATLLWLVTRLTLEDNRFPRAASDEARLRKAQDLLNAESDYVAEAMAAVETMAPTDAEIAQLVAGLQAAAPAQ